MAKGCFKIMSFIEKQDDSLLLHSNLPLEFWFVFENLLQLIPELKQLQVVANFLFFTYVESMHIDRTLQTNINSMCSDVVVAGHFDFHIHLSSHQTSSQGDLALGLCFLPMGI